MIEMAIIDFFVKNNIEPSEQTRALVEVARRADDEVMFLKCLEAAGVDNWSGYEYAVELREGVGVGIV